MYDNDCQICIHGKDEKVSMARSLEVVGDLTQFPVTDKSTTLIIPLQRDFWKPQDAEIELEPL